MATIVASAGPGSGNWTTGSTWIGGVAPTDADDAQIPLNSLDITLDTGAVCRSADFTTYTGTLTHTSGVAWNIGKADGNAGLSNIALKLVSGMTYAPAADTCTIAFIGTSSTAQTIDFASKNTGSVSFTGAAGSWTLAGTWGRRSATMTVTHTRGTLNTANQTCSWGLYSSNNVNTRALTLGSSAIDINGVSSTAWNLQGAGMTLTANTSVITISGANAGIIGGAKTYASMVFSGAGTALIGDSSTNTFTTALTRNGTAVKTDLFTITGNIVISSGGTLTLAGQSVTNRLLVKSGTLGTAITITNSGATMAWSNVDFRDIAVGTAYDASGITGNSGDCGGNTNITFTTGATQTSTAGNTSSFTWSTHGWNSGRVPLPQDDVAINNSFSVGQTVTMDMPRGGKSISWAGATGSSLTWAKTTATTVYGSVTMITGLLNTGTTAFTFEGRGNFILTCAGAAFTNPVTIAMFGGKLSLADAFSCTGSGLTLNNGELDAANSGVNANVTALTFSSSNSNLRTITMGTGTWTLSSTGTVWGAATSSGMTVTVASPTAGTIDITDTSVTSKTFAAGTSQSYGNIKFSGKNIIVTYTTALAFANIALNNVGDATGVTFPASTTITCTGFTSTAAAGSVAKLISSSGGTKATISKASGTVSVDYCTITDSAATGGALWYAGANSTLSNTTGWINTGIPAAVAAVFAYTSVLSSIVRSKLKSIILSDR